MSVHYKDAPMLKRLALCCGFWRLPQALFLCALMPLPPRPIPPPAGGFQAGSKHKASPWGESSGSSAPKSPLHSWLDGNGNPDLISQKALLEDKAGLAGS